MPDTQKQLQDKIYALALEVNTFLAGKDLPLHLTAASLLLLVHIKYTDVEGDHVDSFREELLGYAATLLQVETIRQEMEETNENY